MFNKFIGNVLIIQGLVGLCLIFDNIRLEKELKEANEKGQILWDCYRLNALEALYRKKFEEESKKK